MMITGEDSLLYRDVPLIYMEVEKNGYPQLNRIMQSPTP